MSKVDRHIFLSPPVRFYSGSIKGDLTTVKTAKHTENPHKCLFLNKERGFDYELVTNLILSAFFFFCILEANFLSSEYILFEDKSINPSDSYWNVIKLIIDLTISTYNKLSNERSN